MSGKTTKHVPISQGLNNHQTTQKICQKTVRPEPPAEETLKAYPATKTCRGAPSPMNYTYIYILIHYTSSGICFFCTFFLLIFVIISYLIFSAIMMINDRPTEHHHCPRMAGSPLHHHRKMSTLELQRAVENASNLHQTSIIIDIMTS